MNSPFPASHDSWMAPNMSIEAASRAFVAAARTDESLFFVMDGLTRRVVYIQGSPQPLFGISREDFISDPSMWEQCLTPYDRATLVGLREELTTQKMVAKLFQATGADGVLRSLRYDERLIEIDGRSLVCGWALPMDSFRSEATTADFMRTVVEGARDGLAITDATGRFVYLNREHVDMFGYDCEAEIIGKPWQIFYTPETVRLIEAEVFPELGAQKIWRGELQAKRKDGSLFYESLSLSLLPGGEIVCNCRDVSEQVAVAERLAQSEDIFRVFLNALPTGVMIRQLGGPYEFVNDAARKWFELEAVVQLGAETFQKRLAADLNFASWTEAYQQVEAVGEARTFDFPIFWGGREWILEVQKSPLFLSQTKLSHVCTLMRDVTEQRHLEQQSEATARRREEYYMMQREFISMVSHEFRTPLTSIKGVHYLLGNRTVGLPTEQGDDFRRLLSLQGQAIANLKELVDQVLLLNQLEHAATDAVLTSVNLSRFFTDLIEGLDISVAHGRIRLKVNLPADYVAPVSPTKIRAAVENLVSNALKYSSEDSEVQVTVDLTDQGWRISVADCGRGIPGADQAKLFQPFHRASNVDGVSGTGLGLAIIRRVTDFHNGTVSFSSTQGVGSEFTLSFPDGQKFPSAPAPQLTARNLSIL